MHGNNKMRLSLSRRLSKQCSPQRAEREKKKLGDGKPRGEGERGAAAAAATGQIKRD